MKMQMLRTWGRRALACVLAAVVTFAPALGPMGPALGQSGFFSQPDANALNRSWADRLRDAVSIKDFAKCDGVTDDTAAIVKADAFAYANGFKSIYVPAGSCYAPKLNTSEANQAAHSIFIGEGEITGAYGARVIKKGDPTVHPDGNVIPERHLLRTSSTPGPVAVLAGDSISTEQPNGTLLETENLWSLFKQQFTDQNPTKNFTFYNRAIGGQTFTAFNGAANSNWPAWYTVTTDPWLGYIQSLNPDLVAIAFGMNDRWAFIPAQTRAAVSTMLNWSKVPDLVFITNSAPTRLATGSDYSTYSDQFNQEGRDHVAGYIRSYAQLNGYGLIDGNRAFHILRDGYDPTISSLTRVINAQALTTTYLPPYESNDFAWELSFGSPNPLAAGRKLLVATANPMALLPYGSQTGNFTIGRTVTGATSAATGIIFADVDSGTTGTLKIYVTSGTFQSGEIITDGAGGSATTTDVVTRHTVQQWLELSDSGSSTIKVRLYELTVGAGTQVDNVNTDTGVAVPTSNIVYKIQMSGGRLSVWANGVLAYDQKVQRFGGIFSPVVTMSDASAFNFTGTFFQGQYRRVMPSLSDVEIYQGIDGNQLNHPTSVGAKNIYGPLLRATRLSAAGSPPQLRIASGTSISPAYNNDAEVIAFKKVTGSAETVNLPKAAQRTRDLILIDAKGDASTNNITAVPASGNTIFGPTTISNDYGMLWLRPTTEGDGWYVLAGAQPSVANNSIGNAQLRDSVALSVIGRSANSTGDPGDIAAANDNQILRRSGTTLGFGSIDLSQSNAVGSSVLPIANGGTSGATARGAQAQLSGLYLMCQSAVASSHTGDTNEFVLATCSLPASAMGPNGRLVVDTTWSYTNNANTKTLRVRLGGVGGTAFMQVNQTSTAYASGRTTIYNRNSLSSQIGGQPLNVMGTGNSGTAPATATIDTSTSVAVVITAQNAVAGDTTALEAYTVGLQFKN